MNRLWWRLLAWGMLLPVLAVVGILFTAPGSRLLVDNVSRLLPLEIEYAGGTLAGELQLSRLAWRGEGVELELESAVLELVPSCLWRSRICFRQLYAQRLLIEMLPGPAGDPDLSEDVVDGTLFEFPVPLKAEQLQLDALSVQWAGGEWRQGTMEGAVHISGSTIKVKRALVEDARLELSDSGVTEGPIALPEIHLPLKLVVDELALDRASWDLAGQTGQCESLQLNDGRWLAKNLRLGKLQLRCHALGNWQAAGDIEFHGQWPLAVEGDGRVPEIQGWPGQLGRDLSIKLSGDLAALALQADSGGEVVLSAAGVLNSLDPALPFRLAINGDWPGTLGLAALAAVPEPLAAIVFTAPLQLNASGSLDGQVFQLETTVSGAGYDSLRLRLAGNHEPGRLALEDFHLRDAGDSNTLWGVAEIDYAEQLQWSALLESSGLDLQPPGDYGAGRIEGQLQLLGEFAGEVWSVSLLDADLDGTFNDLPVGLSGYAGIDSDMRLLQTELQAEVNGTRMQLRASADKSRPRELAIEIDDLGRWLGDSRGSLSLQASLAPGWDVFDVNGSLLDLEWQGLQIGSGGINGKYRSGETANYGLDVTLADLNLAGIDLDTAWLSARGNSATLEVSLHSRGEIDGMLKFNGDFGTGGTWTGELAATTLQTSEGNWYLGEPVAMDFSPSPLRLTLAEHCWQFGKARVCPGETLLAEEGHASLALEGDLAAVAAFLPAYLELKGTVTGQFGAEWAPEQSVTIRGQARGRDILFTRHFGNGESGSVAWQEITTRVRNDAAGLSLVAGIQATDKPVIALDLLLPPDRADPVTGTLDIGGLQLATLAPFLPTLSVLAGELRGQLRLHGTVEQPRAEGSLYLLDGNFALLGNPTELQQLELQLDARGDTASLNGRGSLGGGPLTVNGTLLSQPQWRLELGLEGDHHEILLPPYTQMLVSEQLAMIVTGGLLDMSGDIVVHEGTLEHEQLPEGGVTLSDDVVEVDLTGNVVYERAPYDISMSVGVLIEDQFRIVGDMVNATLGGDLQVRQEPRQPLQVFGNLRVIHGELRAYQQRLRIQRGTVSFAGTPENPELDVRALREISGSNVVVGLELQGTMEQPRLELYSDPVMPQGETMSYLVRGRGLDSGADTDGVAMALSLGSGLVNQSALVTELNSIPGISDFAFGAEGSTEADTAATVGGYIGERLFLSYGMGIYEPINVLTARLYLHTRLWLEVVSRLENSVDLYYSFDIK